MKATWKPFSIATSAAISATMVLPEPTSPWRRRFIGCGRFMSPTISRDDLLLIAGQLERQHAPRRFAHLVGDDDRARLDFGAGLALAQHQPALEEEELLEDQPALRRRAEAVQLVEARVFRRKVRLAERGSPVEEAVPFPECGRQRIRQDAGQLRQRMVHEHALHLGRDRTGLLVDRNDAAGMQRVVVMPAMDAGGRLGIVGRLREDFVLRVLQLQPVRRQLELAEQDDALVRTEDVVEERLVEPDGA